MPTPAALTRKRCTGPCAQVKPLEAFHARAASADGRQNKCRACVEAYNSSRKGQAAKRRYAATHQRIGGRRNRKWIKKDSPENRD